MTKRRMAWAGVALTLMLTGCGKLSGPANEQLVTPSKTAAIRPMTVGLEQSGTTLRVHIGQQLIVKLGIGFGVPRSAASSLNYPSDLLAFNSDATPSGTYVFQGRTAGTGRIWIAEPGCSPGPALSNDGPPAHCPVVGPAGSDRGDHASWLFVATVRVVPLGL
jgi:hypothetical protein